MLRTSQMLSREVQESMDTVLLGEEFVRYCEANGMVHEKPRRRGAHSDGNDCWAPRREDKNNDGSDKSRGRRLE